MHVLCDRNELCDAELKRNGLVVPLEGAKLVVGPVLRGFAMIQPIPREELDRAARRLARNVASVIIRAMAERDCSFEDVDRRLGRRKGWTRRYVYRLADGDGRKGIKTLGAVAYGLGVKFIMTLTPKENEDERGGRKEEDSGAAGSDATGNDGAPAG